MSLDKTMGRQHWATGTYPYIPSRVKKPMDRFRDVHHKKKTPTIHGREGYFLHGTIMPASLAVVTLKPAMRP
jgi:hypothetical protein